MKRWSIALIFVATIADLQARAKEHARPTTARHVGPFSEVPAVLPDGFNGHDAQFVFGGAFKAKGEFETTEEYEKRRASAIRPGVYVFVWPYAVPSYDADRQVLTFKLPTAKLIEGFSSTGTDAYYKTSVDRNRHLSDCVPRDGKAAPRSHNASRR